MFDLDVAKSARFFVLCLESGICKMSDVRGWVRGVLADEKVPTDDKPEWLTELSVCSDRRAGAALNLLREQAEPTPSLETALAFVSQLDYAFRTEDIGGRYAAQLLSAMTARGDLPEDFQYLAFLLEHTFEAVDQGKLSEKQARTEIGRHLGRYANFDALVPVKRSQVIVRFVPNLVEPRAASL